MNPNRRPSPPPPQPHALRRAVAAALLLAAQATSAVPAATAGAIHDSRIAAIAAYARRFTDGLGARPDGEPVAITNCNDAGPGSLRQALLEASDDVQLDLTALACSRISLTTGALTTSANVSLYAPIVFSEGRPGPGFTIDAQQASRAIESTGSREIRLIGIALRNGRSSEGKGGCLHSTASLALVFGSATNCAVTATGNAAALGGAAWAGDQAQVVASTISGNTAAAPSGGYSYGGGVFATHGMHVAFSSLLGNEATGYGYGGGAAGTGPFEVVNSTIAHNRALSEAGLGIFGGPSVGPGELLIVNSTITKNSATGAIGGVGCSGDLHVSNSTIFENAAAAGAAGITLHGSRTLDLRSSIVVGNGLLDIDAAAIVGDHDFVGWATVQSPPGTLDGDPLFGSFGDHGGLVDTIALRPGSPAIDAGSDPHVRGCDGRGGEYDEGMDPSHVFPRAVGAAADIGAYEANAEDVLFADGVDETGFCGTRA